MNSPVASLFILAIPVACISWTVTHEEVFREPREYCARQSKRMRTFIGKKFFYLFTCEYCFSHYVALAFLAITHFQLLYTDWRGYLVGGFSLVWIANIYISLFSLLKMDIKREKTIIEKEEQSISHSSPEPPKADSR